MSSLSVYLPQDRLRALARGEPLPDRTTGSALFADISGFTSLTEALRESIGPRRGAEELTKHLDAVYAALIAEVEKYGGSVIEFAGDAIMCWFDETIDSKGFGNPSSSLAVTCAFALQQAMRTFASIALPTTTVTLSLKIAVASGPARRLVVGDPAIHYLDALAGATITRTASAEHLTQKGEVLLDEITVNALGETLTIKEWRTDTDSGARYAVVEKFAQAVSVEPHSFTPTLNAEQLQPWLHRAVYQREVSWQGSFLTEFRPCVALFVRFSGIDFDSDEAGKQLDTFIRRAQTIVARYDGTFLQITIGDKGSYAYINFGVLSTHEDDARRAAKAAIDLKKDAADLGFLAPLQIALTQGLMYVGAYGGPTRRTFSAIGDEVNLAARLMQAAGPGEILLSSHVHQALMQEFIFEPRPALTLKGKAEPLTAFVLTGERQHRAIRLQEPSYALPMVGREKELAIINEQLTMALQGKGQVIGIVAEAGLGKSRLVAEVIRLARKKDFAGYGGVCQSDAINTPYQTWKTIWSALFDVDPAAPLRKQIRSLEGEIEDRVPERLAAVPLLSSLLNLAIPDNDFTQTLAPKDRKGALHALLEDYLKAAAQDEPLLIVIEDLHWIDALSYDLLDELARAVSGYPIVFVLAYRPLQTEGAQLIAARLENLPHFTKIELSELSAAECDQAVRAKLAQLYPARGGAVPIGLVQKLMAHAQGNPFYLEELLNFLRDRGLDPRDPSALDKIELPDSLYALILSRIDQLTEHEKTTLRVASIIGRLFRAAWLTGYYPALGALPQVKADLDELRALDITPLDTPEPELAYLFKHIVTHEVTYESLPFATRAQLHEQLAQFIETLGSDRYLNLLAFHYSRSENTLKQREYLAKAAEVAQATFANDAALDYYARLLPLLTDLQAQLEIHLKRGAVLELIGKWAEGEVEYRTALSLAEQAQDAAAAARCQHALGVLCRLRSDYGAGLEWLGRARASWETLGDRSGVSQAAIQMGTVFVHQGDYIQAQHHLETGLALARELDDKRSAASAFNNLGLVAYNQGDSATARILYEEGLTLRREMGDKRGISIALNNLGNVAYELGDYAAVQALYEECLKLSREMGDVRGISAALNNLGAVAYTQGDYATARALQKESLALKRTRGDKRGITTSLINVGNLAIEQNDSALAQATYLESLGLSNEMGDKKNIVYNLSGLAAVAILLGDLPRAVRLAAVAETLRLNLGAGWEPIEGRIYDRTLAAAKAALSEEVFNAAWNAGKQMTLEGAIEYALQELKL
jgi:class 3 adenylate cyclase/predicted ATPase